MPQNKPPQDVWSSIPSVDQQGQEQGSVWDKIEPPPPITVDKPLRFHEVVAADRANEEENVETLKTLLKKPGLDPTQAIRIGRLLKTYTDPMLYNRVTDENRGILNNFVRGAAHGILDYTILGATDLVLAAAELPFNAAAKLSGNKELVPDSLHGLRERVWDTQAATKEFLDPQGYAGAAGTVGGVLFPPTSAATYGRLSMGATKGIAKITPGVSAILKRGLAPGASYLERLAAHAIGNVGIDAVAITDVLINPNISDEDKTQAILTQMAMSAVGAGTGALHKNKAPGAGGLIPATDHTPPADATIANIDVMAQAAQAMRIEVQAKNFASRQVKSEVRKEWESAHPNVKWGDLSKDAKKSLLDEFRLRKAAEEANITGAGDENVINQATEQIAKSQFERWTQGAKVVKDLQDGDTIEGPGGMWQKLGDNFVQLNEQGGVTGTTIAVESLDGLNIAGTGKVVSQASGEPHISQLRHPRGEDIRPDESPLMQAVRTIDGKIYSGDSFHQVVTNAHKAGSLSDVEAEKIHQFLVREKDQRGNLYSWPHKDLPSSLAVTELGWITTRGEFVQRKDMPMEFPDAPWARMAKQKVGQELHESLGMKMASMYEVKAPVTAMKEFMQNAVDAAEMTGGDVDIKSNSAGRAIVISDRGPGMTPQAMKDYFLTIGGSNKDATVSRGAFGVATASPLRSAELIEVTTVAKAPGGYQVTKLTGKRGDYENKTMNMEDEVLSPTQAAEAGITNTGTIIKVQFPEEAKDRWYEVEDFLHHAMAFSELPTKTTASVYNLWSGQYDPAAEPIDFSNHIVEKIELPTATLILKKPQEVSDITYAIKMPVRVRGLYQFQFEIPFKGVGPAYITVDVNSKVQTSNPDYPFTFNRGQLKDDVLKEVKKAVQPIINAASLKESADLLDRYEHPHLLPTGVPLIRTSANVTEEAIAEFAKKPYLGVWGKAMQDVTHRMWDVLRKVPPYTKLPQVSTVGVYVDGESLGININIGRLVLAAEAAGVEPSRATRDGGFAIYYNPYAIAFEVQKLVEVLPTAQALADHTIGTVAHEIGHNLFGGHNEEHNGAVTRFIGPVARYAQSEIRMLEQAWQAVLDDKNLMADMQQAENAKKGAKNVFKKYAGHLSRAEDELPKGVRIVRADTGDDLPVSEGGNGLGGAGEPGRTEPVDGATDETGVVSAIAGQAPRDEGSREEVNKRLTQDLPKPPDEGGVMLYTHPAATGFAAGATMGMLMPADDEEERTKHAIYMAIAGAGVGYAGRRLTMRSLRKAAKAQLPDYAKRVDEQIKGVDDETEVLGPGFFTRFRRWTDRVYAGWTRGSLPVEKVSTAAGVAPGAPVMRNPGKLAEIFGLNRTIANNWFFDGPSWTDTAGNDVQFGIPSMQMIVHAVDGDLAGLGKLAGVMRTLELAGQPQSRKTGISITDARQYAANIAQKYHDALPMLTAFGKALAKVGNLEGMVSDAVFAKWNDAFYVPMRKIFGQRTPTGTRPLQNPAEALIEMVPRMLRAAELNRLVKTLFDTIDASPNRGAIVGEGKLVQPIGKGRDPHANDLLALAKQLKQDIADNGGHLTLHEAHELIQTMSDRTLSITDDIVRFRRNGEVEAWRVNADMAKALRHLQSTEIEEVFKGLGWAVKVNDVAKVGVTANPKFILWQAFRDNWQYYMNGEYGTLPVVSQIRPFVQQLKGYKNIVTNSAEYQRYKSVGGGSDSIASQGLRVIEGKAEVIERMREPIAKNMLVKAGQEFAHGSWRSAYASLMAPLADAARVGAYLYERGRGTSVIDAVYKAKKVGANYNQRGSFTAIRALNRMVLFLNPSLQSLDASKDALKTNPVGYMIRGIMGLAIPSALLWAAYHDDDEVQEVRKGPVGDGNWVIRGGNGTIMTIPKPIFDGKLWATSMEKALDRWMDQDPYTAREWATSTIDDASINLLPTLGIIPISMWANKVWGLGSQIVPDARERAQTEFQAGRNTGTLARVVGSTTGPLADDTGSETLQRAASPAGMEFMVRALAGGLGEAAITGASQLLDAVQKGYIPAKEEAVFVKSLFAKYPSTGVGSVRQFYETLDRMEKIGVTQDIIVRTKPERLTPWIENNERDLILAPVFLEKAKAISDLRKAIIDMEEAPTDVADQGTRRDLIKMWTDQIILQAKTANDIAKAIPQ